MGPTYVTRQGALATRVLNRKRPIAGRTSTVSTADEWLVAMEELALLTNASASYEEVKENGPSSVPLDFSNPLVGKASRVTATVYNPATSEEAQVPNVVYEVRGDQPPQRAYWIGRKLKKAIYGCVRSCTVLKLREGGWQGPGQGGSWEVTPDMAAVKIMDWNKVQELRGRHMEDPVKEVSAMQFIARGGPHPNVLGTLDVLSDQQYLYSFMPFCSCGELFGFVERDGRFSEPVARFWFRQLLNVSLCVKTRNCCLSSQFSLCVVSLLLERTARRDCTIFKRWACAIETYLWKMSS